MEAIGFARRARPRSQAHGEPMQPCPGAPNCAAGAAERRLRLANTPCGELSASRRFLEVIAGPGQSRLSSRTALDTQSTSRKRILRCVTLCCEAGQAVARFLRRVAGAQGSAILSRLGTAE